YSGAGKFTEVGYASAYSRRGSPRSIGQLERMVEAAKDRQFILLRSWNEFSSTDEFITPNDAHAFTLEPNTLLYKFDGSGGDTWFYYNRLKAKLSSLSK